MTDLITRDPNDTGDIVIPGEGRTRDLKEELTRNLTPYTEFARPVRLSDATGEMPRLIEAALMPTGAELAVTGTRLVPAAALAAYSYDPGDYPKPPPLPKPKGYVGRLRSRGRHAVPPPRWAVWSLRIGLALAPLAPIAAVVLGLLAVTR